MNDDKRDSKQRIIELEAEVESIKIAFTKFIKGHTTRRADDLTKMTQIVEEKKLVQVDEIQEILGGSRPYVLSLMRLLNNGSDFVFVKGSPKNPSMLRYHDINKMQEAKAWVLKELCRRKKKHKLPSISLEMIDGKFNLGSDLSKACVELLQEHKELDTWYDPKRIVLLNRSRRGA